MPVFRLSAQPVFPPVELARPDGLLAVGGDLTPDRLVNAYREGIFPWFSEGEPLLWWSPDPRLILRPEWLHLPNSLQKVIRRGRYRITFDQAFDQVVEGCAIPREDAAGTWITRSMAEAYGRLHRLGYAHSVEAWEASRLVGGVYGVALGSCFFGESMFYREPDASKVAFVALVAQLGSEGCRMIDCQMTTAHLVRFGAREVPRREFVAELRLAVREQAMFPQQHRPIFAGAWGGSSPPVG